MRPGIAAGARDWWLALIAGEAGFTLPDELVRRVRLFEGGLPFLCRVMRVPRVASCADLLPDDDAEMGGLLELVHDWAGAMLDAFPSDVIEVEATEIVGELPAAAPASDGSSGAGAELPA